MIQGCGLQLRSMLVLLLLPDLSAMFVVVISSVDDQSIGKIDSCHMRWGLCRNTKENKLGP